MEALFDTCKQLVIEITKSCLASDVYAEECLKLARYASKCALVLTEIEMHMHVEESLRGSQSLFRAVDGMIAALKQVQQLAAQCSSARGGGVWPLEDAVEFQAVALELQNGMLGFTKVRDPLPPDVIEDLQLFLRQLGDLQFTTSELAETEVLVESSAQHTPRAGDASNVPGSPFGGARAPAAILVTPPVDPTPAQAEKGAGEGAGLEEPSSPLPDDPFNMDSRLQSSTVRELEGLKLQPAEAEELGVSLGEESLLEARPDNLDVLQKGVPADADADALHRLRELAEAGRTGGGLEGIEEGPWEGEGEGTWEGEDDGGEEELGALVEDVVAMMEEEEEEGGEGEAAGGRQGQGQGRGPAAAAAEEEGDGDGKGTGEGEGQAAPPTPTNGHVKRQLSPASALAELAASSLEHLAHGDN